MENEKSKLNDYNFIMEEKLNLMFKSIIDMEHASVVICDLEHTIVYMNPAAIGNYGKWGGDKLIGQSLLFCHAQASQEKIIKVVEWFEKSKENNCMYTFYNEKQNKDVYMIALRDEAQNLIGYYEKHEYRNKEQKETYEGLE